MKLIGELNRSFGNFVTLRGIAKMGDIEKISRADEGYQRNLYLDHGEAMVNFLQAGEYTFFPELILSITLGAGKKQNVANEIYKSVPNKSFHKKLAKFNLNAKTYKLKNEDDIRVTNYFCRGEFIPKNSTDKILQRIDGNHRLSATEKAGKKDLLVPFCIIFLTNEEDKFNRVLFNNINYKQLPLTSEENLKIIFEKNTATGKPLFSDDELKDPVWFGKEYIEARKLYNEINLENIKSILKNKDNKDNKNEFTRTLLLEFSKIYEEKIKVEEFEKALKAVDQCYDTYENGQGYQLLIVHLYYYFANALDPFSNWVKENYIYNLKEVSPQGLIEIFDKLRKAKKRTIFLAMDFGDAAKQNYDAIESAIGEINKGMKSDINKGMKSEINLELIRIDKNTTGSSFSITDKILKHLEEGAYLIADISLGNKNVYYEIGYQMGLNKGKGLKHENFLLVHNEGIEKSDFDKDLSFNISNISVIKCNDSNDLREKVKKQIEIYYKINNE